MLRPPWPCAAGAVILALAVPHLAAAQAPAPRPATAAAPTPSFAPALAATHLSFSAEDHAPFMVNASAARLSSSEGKAAAIVGAAGGVVIGLVVGGDTGTAIAIGGASLGLFVIYIWQRGTELAGATGERPPSLGAPLAGLSRFPRPGGKIYSPRG